MPENKYQNGLKPRRGMILVAPEVCIHWIGLNNTPKGYNFNNPAFQGGV